MLTLVVLATLAAPPVIRAHTDAAVVIHIPRLDAVTPVVAFFEQAGQRSTILRPQTWQNELHPFLWLDFSRPDTFTSAGIDPAGSFTVSVVGDSRMTCSGLSQAKRMDERAARRMSALGTAFDKKLPGNVRVMGAKAGGKTVGGYARSEKVACAVQVAEGDDADGLLEEAAKRVRSGATGKNVAAFKTLPAAPVYLLSSDGAATLDTEGQKLKLHARSHRVPLPRFEANSSTHAYGGVTPSGLLFLRGTIASGSLASALRPLVEAIARVCVNCTRASVLSAADQITSALNGEFLLRVDRLDLSGSLRTDASRYFAAKHAFIAKLNAGVSTKMVEAALAKVGTARDRGYVVATAQGDVLAGVREGHVYLANDEKALNQTWEKALASGKLGSGAQVILDPPALARALSSLSFLDVVGSRELAALFAVSAEAGPLLAASTRAEAVLNTASDGASVLDLTWTLAPRD